MEAQELQDRLAKLYAQNEPDSTMNTMPEDLKEAFDQFIRTFAKTNALSAMMVLAAIKSIEPILSGTFCQGFWLGHDYALEHGQLRGD